MATTQPVPKLVTVTVTATQTGSASTVTITVSPEPVVLDKNTNGQGEGAHVHWDISNGSTNGWKFSGAGIVIDKPGNKFSNKGQSGGGKRHTWQRDDVDGNDYKYTISVTNGDVTATVDPTIRNF
jgi:hypothetical protein